MHWIYFLPLSPGFKWTGSARPHLRRLVRFLWLESQIRGCISPLVLNLQTSQSLKSRRKPAVCSASQEHFASFVFGFQLLLAFGCWGFRQTRLRNFALILFLRFSVTELCCPLILFFSHIEQKFFSTNIPETNQQKHVRTCKNHW